MLYSNSPRFVWSVIVVYSLLLLLLLLPSVQLVQSKKETTTTTPPLSPHQQQQSTGGIGQKKTVRKRRVDRWDRLDLKSERLSLTRNATTTLSCQRTRTTGTTTTTTNLTVAWHGECDGGFDANFVEFSDGNLTATFGSFHTETEVCVVSPDANGVPSVHCTSLIELHAADIDDNDIEEEPLLTDDDGFLDDLATHERNLNSLNTTFAMSHVGDLLSNRRRLFDDSGATVDVMVVWTKGAECLASNLSTNCTHTAQTSTNMRGLIDLAVYETNVAFSLSNIVTRLRLVHAYRDDFYDEPSPLTTNVNNVMLADLTQVSDGKLDIVHVKRSTYGADIVQMIAGNVQGCGVAHMGPDKFRAFSISRFSCIVGYYSFSHELAHNFGAHHDRPTLGKCTSDTTLYNFGYRDPAAQFRTIMAYDCQMNQCDNLPKSNCQRIQRFSNPDTTHNGVVVGDNSSNNARVINEASAVVAAFYPAMDCTHDNECDDGDATTINVCLTDRRVCLFTPIPPSTAVNAAMETLVIPSVTSRSWTSVLFKHKYERPVAVCSVQYYNAGAAAVMVPAVVRLTSVQTVSMFVRLQNPSKADTGSRPVHCLVMEEGRWTLPDGRKAEAWRVESTVVANSAAWVATPRPYSHTYTYTPVVLGQVHSFRDVNWSTFWCQGAQRWDTPDPNFLSVGYHVGGDPNTVRKMEEIAYIVMDRRAGSVGGGRIVDSGRTAVIPHAYVSGSYVTPFPVGVFTTTTTHHAPPVATIVSQVGMAGADGCWAVLTTPATVTGFGLAVDEDQVGDTERFHTGEQVDYVAVSSLAPILLSRV